MGVSVCRYIIFVFVFFYQHTLQDPVKISGMQNFDTTVKIKRIIANKHYIGDKITL
jgi:hypothetical protein